MESSNAFNPQLDILKGCSFFIVAQITERKTGEVNNSGAVAFNYQYVPAAIGAAFYGYPESFTEGQQAVIERTAEHLSKDEVWTTNRCHGGPLMGLGHFSDDEWDVSVTLIALIDAIHGGTKSAVMNTETALEMMKAEVSPIQIMGGDLLEGLLETAEMESAIPFVGVISPDVFGHMLSQAADSDRLSMTLLQCSGDSEALTPTYRAIDNADDIIEVEIAYAPTDEEGCREDDIVLAFSGMDAAIRHHEDLIYFRMTAPKGAVMQVLDSTTDRFVGLRTFGHAEE